jgi:hypothetical protein
MYSITKMGNIQNVFRLKLLVKNPFLEVMLETFFGQICQNRFKKWSFCEK